MYGGLLVHGACVRMKMAKTNSILNLQTAFYCKVT